MIRSEKAWQSMSDIYSLLNEARGGLSAPEYRAKMMHPVPSAPVIKRERYLMDQARGKVVLDIGASGPMSEAIKQVAKEYHSINRDNAEWCIDLDSIYEEVLPEFPGLELVICGEVIEHLSNPGHFLGMLIESGYDCPIILTTPNAFNSTGAYHVSRGIECVNPEHVAYYSYHTLKGLVERHGFKVSEWYWYNGKPLTAEGLIFRLER